MTTTATAPDYRAWPPETTHDYCGPAADAYAALEETLCGERDHTYTVDDPGVPLIYAALCAIAGEGWARYSLCWALRLDALPDFAAETEQVPRSSIG